jgi:hypothetical protein
MPVLYLYVYTGLYDSGLLELKKTLLMESVTRIILRLLLQISMDCITGPFLPFSDLSLPFSALFCPFSTLCCPFLPFSALSLPFSALFCPFHPLAAGAAINSWALKFFITMLLKCEFDHKLNRRNPAKSRTLAKNFLQIQIISTSLPDAIKLFLQSNLGPVL